MITWVTARFIELQLITDFMSSILAMHRSPRVHILGGVLGFNMLIRVSNVDTNHFSLLTYITINKVALIIIGYYARSIILHSRQCTLELVSVYKVNSHLTVIVSLLSDKLQR